MVSTFNTCHSAITSSMAIVPTTNGFIDAFTSSMTQLIPDITSYFAPKQTPGSCIEEALSPLSLSALQSDLGELSRTGPTARFAKHFGGAML
jgi:hypothetical protein